MIHVYTVCWNEERILPYFLRHYSRFAERIIVYDNYSTDGSRQILASDPRIEVRTFGAPEEPWSEWSRVSVRRHAWKESRGRCHWVVVVDCDELLWHPRLGNYLDACRRRGVTLPKPHGYEMVSETFPDGTGQILDSVTRGCPSPGMSKWVLFDPEAIDEINYGPGSHEAHPRGRVVMDEPPALKLLHFKHLGLPYLLQRYQMLETRTTDLDRRMGWRIHYNQNEEQIRTGFEALLRRAEPVLDGPD